MIFESLSRKTEMIDPHMGTWQYEYDPDGSVIQRTDSQATHTWTAGGQFSIQVQGVNVSTSSVWSPSDSILISTYSIQTALEMPILLGASANFATDSSYISSNTVNEPLTGRSSGTSHIVHWGYQGTNIAPSSFSVLYLGPQGPGGADASSTPELNSSDLITYSTSTTPIGTIALNLLEHGTTSYTDANGNFIAENGRWLAYDFENRPINLVTQDGTLDQFQYDYQGRRTQQIVTPISQSSQTTTYAGESYEVSGSTITKYISAGSLRVAMLLNGSTTYFLPDYLGSTNRLVNAKKGVVRTNDYLPFGFTYLTSGSLDDDHKYTGQRLDLNTGLYYYGARYYDPLLGLFVSPNPRIQNLFDPQTLNRYVYCRNNPLRLVDPSGLDFDNGDSGNSGDFSNLNLDNAFPVISMSSQLVQDWGQPNNLSTFNQRVNFAMLETESFGFGFAAGSFFGGPILGFMGGLGTAGAVGSSYLGDTPFQSAQNGLFLFTLPPLVVTAAVDPAIPYTLNQLDPELAASYSSQLNQVSQWVSDLLGPASQEGGMTVQGQLNSHLQNAIKNYQLTDRQKMALVDNPQMGPAFRGTQIDTLFKSYVQDDPFLNEQGIMTTPRGQFGPDVINIYSGQWWDVTTPGQWNAHVQKYSLWGVGSPLLTQP